VCTLTRYFDPVVDADSLTVVDILLGSLSVTFVIEVLEGRHYTRFLRRQEVLMCMDTKGERGTKIERGSSKQFRRDWNAFLYIYCLDIVQQFLN
jgi:hypothetical protein